MAHADCEAEAPSTFSVNYFDICFIFLLRPTQCHSMSHLAAIQASHLIFKAEPSHPVEETHFSQWYPQSHFPVTTTELMITGDSWNID